MKKVLLGMSGGIDSSSSAILLKEQGFEVVGVTFNLLNETGISKDAKFFCDENNIVHHEVNYSDIFNKKIINYFKTEYLEGRTPNPCIMCNKLIKFPLLWEEAKKQNCDYIATGHYARIVNYNNKNFIAKGLDKIKDQSYFLFSVPSNLLGKIIFPLGEYTKPLVKEMAISYGIKSNRLKESQDVCFIKNDYRNFLNFKNKIGFFKDSEGKVIGKHNGYFNYTIGQRKGLGLTHHERFFVESIDAKTNTVYLSKKNNLYKDEVIAKNPIIIDKELLLNSNDLSFQVRYSSEYIKGSCTFDGNKLFIKLAEPCFGVAKGQALVAYHNDLVLAGGWIE